MHGATGANGQTRDANAERVTRAASGLAFRVTDANQLSDNELLRAVTRVTRVTRNRGPFPGGGGLAKRDLTQPRMFN